MKWLLQFALILIFGFDVRPGRAEVVVFNTSAFGGATAAATSYFATNLQQANLNFNLFGPLTAWATSGLATATAPPAGTYAIARVLSRGSLVITNGLTQITLSGSTMALTIDIAPELGSVGTALASAGASCSFYVTEPVAYALAGVNRGSGTNFVGLLSNNIVLARSGSLKPGAVYVLSALAQVSGNGLAQFGAGLVISSFGPGTSSTSALAGAEVIELLPSRYLTDNPGLTLRFNDELIKNSSVYESISSGQVCAWPGGFGADFVMTSASRFASVEWPAGESSQRRYDVRVGTRHLGTLAPGGRIDFLPALGTNVAGFRFLRVDQTTDAPASVPLRLNFTTGTANFEAVLLPLPQMRMEMPGLITGQIAWFGHSRLAYQLQSSADLRTWMNLGQLQTGVSDLELISDSVTGTRNYYRLQLKLD